jgi:hypothetical protein
MAAIELRDLRYLAASAVAGNFVRAAESLGLNASTISRRIAWLEDELVALHSDSDGLHTAVRLARAGVSDQREPRCCEESWFAF